jgi:hypothetical protein
MDPENGDSEIRLKKLGGIVAKSDRVSAANSTRGLGLTVSGDEAQKVVRAVSAARSCDSSFLSYSCYLTFYRGTNFLAGVLLEGSRFALLPRNKPHMEVVPGIGAASVTYSDECCDDSGVLQHLYDSVSPPLSPDRRPGAAF